MTAVWRFFGKTFFPLISRSVIPKPMRKNAVAFLLVLVVCTLFPFGLEAGFVRIDVGGTLLSIVGFCFLFFAAPDGWERYRCAVCVPVRPETAPEDAVVLPECRVLSVLYCGDYSGVDEMWLTLGREVKARGLTPAEAPRILGIVAPYTGREIETKRYCSRLVLPVKD